MRCMGGQQRGEHAAEEGVVEDVGDAQHDTSLFLCIPDVLHTEREVDRGSRHVVPHERETNHSRRVFPFRAGCRREKEAGHGQAEVEVLRDDLDAGIVLPGLRRSRRDFDVMQQLPSGMMRLKTWYWPSIPTGTQNLRSAQPNMTVERMLTKNELVRHCTRS